jgi:hypothetical protein
MEKIEDIENFLIKEYERIDKEFLEKLKTIKNPNEKNKLGENYKNQLKNSQEQYKKKFNKYLLEQKDKIKKEINERSRKKIKEERVKKFEVKEINLKDNWSEKFILKWESFRFKFGITKRNFINKMTPNWWIIFKFKAKIKMKNLRSGIQNSFKRIIINIKKSIIKLFLKIKNLMSFIFLIIKNILKFILRKVFLQKKPKEENKSEDKKEGVKEQN